MRLVQEEQGICQKSGLDKANNILGWKAERTLEDMCRDAWNWQMKNPNGYEV